MLSKTIPNTIPPHTLATAQQVLRDLRVGVFIVSYNAERFIDSVLARIPPEIRDGLAEIYLIDDSSTDLTLEVAQKARQQLCLSNLAVFRTPFNRGYGGNQKLGYLYALRSNLDIVVLLHGDGQYPPEHLPYIISQFADPSVDVVLASRMLRKLDALRGRMPVYKWVGNQVLTAIQNRMVGSNLSEFHTGYRAYRTRALRQIPFHFNSDGFHFDTEILIQLITTGHRIVEIPIPTHYGEEICHVNGTEYAVNCLISVLKHRLTQIGLFYDQRFDFNLFASKPYYLKKAPNSLHQAILRRRWPETSAIADLGSNDGELSSMLAEKVSRVTSVDVRLPTKAGKAEQRQLDLNGDFDRELGLEVYDAVLALDVIEHLDSPEAAVQKIFTILKPGGTLYASTGNIAFWLVRFSLLAGQFNYGKRGILDLTHKRLFTVRSFRRLLRQNGFIIRRIEYFGPPIVDMVGDSPSLRMLDRVASFLARVWPTMFAFNFLVVAERTDRLDEIYRRTTASGEQTPPNTDARSPAD